VTLSLREPAAGAATLASRSELTVRSIVTGMVLGATLSLSNVYVGLRIGWSFGVSLTATVLTFAAWRALAALRLSRPPAPLENVIAQTCAGAAGYMASSGLNSAIPALAMVAADGLGPPLQISGPALALWISTISAFGIFVAAALRRSLLDVEDLRFPSGTACAETIRTMYATAGSALGDARRLAIAAAVGGTWKVLVEAPAKLRGALASHGLGILAKIPARVGLPIPIGGSTLGAYGFGLPTGLLLFAAGAIVGPRVGASLAIGAIADYGVLGPRLVERGIVHAADGRFGAAIRTQWGVWPGTALLVAANLASLAFVVARAARRKKGSAREDAALATDDVPPRVIALGLAVTGAACVVLQRALFGVPLVAAVAAVLLAGVLCVVAARATGLTDVPPIGPLGKLAQLVGAGIVPGAASADLLFANMSTGAAAHAAELLTDLRTGKLLGASPRRQLAAQGFGLVAGSVACVPAYLLLARTSAIGGADLPAPAAAAWKAMAEFLARGASVLPAGAATACLVAGGIGVALAVADEVAGPRARRFLPSATGIGIAFLLDAQDSLALFVGSIAAALLARRARREATYAVASGALAGEGIVGIAIACIKAAGG
jgi:uncharacterized oligopeptide transporter (OPT) family protein